MTRAVFENRSNETFPIYLQAQVLHYMFLYNVANVYTGLRISVHALLTSVDTSFPHLEFYHSIFAKRRRNTGTARDGKLSLGVDIPGAASPPTNQKSLLCNNKCKQSLFL